MAPLGGMVAGLAQQYGQRWLGRTIDSSVNNVRNYLSERARDYRETRSMIQDQQAQQRQASKRKLESRGEERAKKLVKRINSSQRLKNQRKGKHSFSSIIRGRKVLKKMFGKKPRGGFRKQKSKKFSRKRKY